jgi:hypothetical protein
MKLDLNGSSLNGNNAHISAVIGEEGTNFVKGFFYAWN